MRYRQLGKTGIFVSEFALGTNTFGGTGVRWEAHGALDQEAATRLVGLALDSGINIIDTADSYGDGEAEVRVGAALKALSASRSDVIVCSKVYQRTGPGPNSVGLSRAHVIDGLHASLKRLKTDYLDIYMLHNFDPLTPIEETLAALDMLKRQGKIRYIGCSNFAAWQIAATMGAAHSRALPRLEVIEAMYTIAAREIEAEILAAAKYFDMSVMVWGALAAGLLTGKYNPPGGAPPADARLTLGGTTIAERGKAFAAVEAMRPIAESKGVSVAQIALAWLLLNQSVASIVIGCKRPDQLEHNLAALDVSFTPDEIERLNAIAAPRLEYPYSMQAAMAARRNPS